MSHAKWSKSIVHWREENDVYVSVVFTWHLVDALKFCRWNQQAGRRVIAGGPAVSLMPHYLADVTDGCGGEMHPGLLSHHNPDATRTTLGCIWDCSFCGVRRIEGSFQELPEWRPAPVVCDSNFLASSRRHFDLVIDRLKSFTSVDFNQGLDVRLLNKHHIDRLGELQLPIIRFAWDHIDMETKVMDAIDKILAAGFAHRRIRCYILFGYDDDPEDALYRAEAIKARGVRPFLQRYQPLDTLAKDTFIGKNWTEEEMARFARYWCRQNWFSRIPYSEFRG